MKRFRKNNLIIGAGQLEMNARKWQSWLKKLFAFLIRQTLEISAIRANEIAHSHSVNYVSDWNKLPKEFNFNSSNGALFDRK